ncbi:MAG: helicase-associated domain-containing protein [Planctomycetaceae bacterium]|nr:helicase-associated domain-containing protein [Planctomycetaceae bacterium]
MARRDTPEILTIQETYEKSTLDTLRPLAKLLDPNAPSKKADLVPFLTRKMGSKEQVQELYESLGDLGKSTVREAVHSPMGQLDPSRFAAKYGQLPSRGMRDEPGKLRAFFPVGWWLPSDLRSMLRKFVPEPEVASVKTVGELPEAVAEAGPSWRFRDGKREREQVPLHQRLTSPAAPREFATMLRLVEAGKVRVSDKTRKPSQATVETILPLLSDGDFYQAEERIEYAKDTGQDLTIRAYAWPCILQAAGLVSLVGGRLELSREGRKALTRQLEVTIRDAWKKWDATKLFDEFDRVEQVKGKSSARLSAVADRRRAVACALSKCPPGGWIEVDDFFRFLKALDLDFTLARNEWRLYVSDANYGSFGYDGRHNWELLQGRFILAVLFEYAATLGLIDVAYVAPEDGRDDFYDHWGADDLSSFSRYDGLKYIRLSPLGAWCLGVAAEYQPEASTSGGSWRVLPNLEIVSGDAQPDAADALFLDRIAERTSEAVWRLERDKILVRVEEGLKLDEIAAFLERHAQGPLPGTVRALLDDLEQRSGRLRDLGTIRMIECTDPETARMLLLDPKLKTLCEPSGKRGIVFRANVESQVRSQLRKLGYVLPST